MRAYARLGMLAVAVGVLMLLPTGDRSVQATDWCSGGVCQEWVARYDGPGSGDDSAVALVMDAAGNVYVTGYSEGSGTGYDYATVKYDANGSQLWAARYNGPANGEDRAADVALDALGNVYVTGYSQGSGTAHDYATAKYDANGNELWVARYNGHRWQRARHGQFAVQLRFRMRHDEILNKRLRDVGTPVERRLLLRICPGFGRQR